jgi:amino acid adenylation domain-containing protein
MSKERKFHISELSQDDFELLDYLLADEGIERQQEPTIVAQSQEGSFVLSFAQEQMWLLNQLGPDSSLYNIPFALRFKGPLDQSVLEQCLNEIIRRHTILHSTFPVIHGHAQQVVQPYSPTALQFIDLHNLPEDLREEEAQRRMQSEAEQTFDLAHGPLLRATLLHFEREHHILILVLHHIVSDSWSFEVFMREIHAFYPAILQKSKPLLNPLSIQYTDYSAWQRSSWEDPVHQEERVYWLQQLANAPSVLELPTTYSRPAVQTFQGVTYPFRISPEISQSLRYLSQQENTTVFMVLLGAFQTLLLRYTDQEDILVGCPIANRDLPEIEPLIGAFINTLVMRTDLSGNPTFQELLERVKHVAAGAYQHQHVPFEYLVKHFDQTRDISRNPLVQIFFVYHNTSSHLFTLYDLEVEPLEIGTHTAKFDLTLRIEDDTRDLHGSIEYNTALYDQNFIASFVHCFQTLLQGIIESPRQHLLELPLLGEAQTETAFDKEYHYLIEGFNRTTCAFPEQNTITQLFEEAVERFPHKIALKFGATELTYAEMNSRANQLARMLREKGAQADTLIGIYTERSLEMLIGLFGILKAGAAYLPLDPHYPEARLNYILEDSQVEIICTQSYFAPHLSRCDQLIFLDDPEWYQGPDANLSPIHHARNLAYVIYTSGTTGNPKGVMVEHRQVVRLLRNDHFQFDFDEHDTWTLFHSFCFDFSVWEMYGALLNGGQLIIIPQLMTVDVPSYRDLLKAERVTVLNQTPGAFFQLCEVEKKHSTHDLSLRYVIFGGEALRPGRLHQWRQFYPTTNLINMYGITETTVHVTYKEILPADIQANISNIGIPIPTTSIYLLNSRLKPVPYGVVGEIFVGGEGVARGYLYNPELTQQRFIAHPFNQNERLYRTGDLGRWINDGEIEYIGRSDQQVKIHGFRIERGEIETHIRKFLDVIDAIVLPMEDTQGELALCSYVVMKQSLHPEEVIPALRAHLKQHLPVHMLPAFIVPISKLPLTEHGKLDKAALPDPKHFTDLGERYVPPRNQLERQLVDIWAEVLNLPREKIGIHSRFFDLGGNSFNVLELHNRVQVALDKLISVLDYFQYPTISSFIEHIANMETSQKDRSSRTDEENDREAIDTYFMMDELTRLAGEDEYERK